MTSALHMKATHLAKIGRCFSPTFSPDGQEIAFISDIDGVPQIWRIPTSGGFPRKVTSGDDPVTSVKWSPTENLLAFQLAPGGGMNSQIYTITPEGIARKRLTPGGQINNWLSGWTKDGKQILAASNMDERGTMSGYLIDCESGVMERIVQNEGTGRISMVDNTSTYALVQRVAYRGDNNIFRVHIPDGEEIVLTPHDAPGHFSHACFGENSQHIYLISNRERDMRGLESIKIGADNTIISMEFLAEREDAELEEFALSHDRQRAALVWNIAGRVEVELFDIGSKQRTQIYTIPTQIVHSITFSPDDKFIAFVATDATTPSDIWIMEVQSHEVSQLTYSPHPGVALDELVQPTLETYTAHDDLSLSGWLYLPANFKKPGAMVLSFHGGPEGQERPLFRAIYQALLEQGIAVFAPNVRGSGGFGKAFVNLDNGALRFNAIKDIRSTTQHVIDAGIAQPGKIGIMGGSYGGYMTMAGLTEYPDDFAAGVNSYGVVNFKTFFEQTEAWMANISKTKYGDPDTESDLLARLSPINKLDRVKAPTLVLHGANDTNVPVVEADQVVNQLRERGVEVEYILFSDEGHGFLKEKNRITADTAIVTWFSKYLL